MDIRRAEVSEIDALALVWRDAWRDGHEAVVPAALARMRTLESFRTRMADGLAQVRVLGPVGAPIGFCMLKGDELHQLFVSAAARGTGAAARLIADGEARLAAAGVEVAWLACAIGNDRAARFYEKSCWHLARTFTSRLETPEGDFELDVWRYEKRVR